MPEYFSSLWCQDVRRKCMGRNIKNNLLEYENKYKYFYDLDMIFFCDVSLHTGSIFKLQ